MKITVSQQNKKTSVNFIHKDIGDKFVIDKVEEFLLCVDKLLKKHHTVKISNFGDAKLEFHNTGMLTERVVRVIMLGLCFYIEKIVTLRVITRRVKYHN